MDNIGEGILVRLAGDSSQLVRAFSASEAAATRFAQTVPAAVQQSQRAVAASMAGVGQSVAGGLAHASAALTGLAALAQSTGYLGQFTAKLYLLVAAGNGAFAVMRSLAGAASTLASVIGSVVAFPFHAIASGIGLVVSGLMTIGKVAGSVVLSVAESAYSMGKSIVGGALSGISALVGAFAGPILSVVGSLFGSITSGVVGATSTAMNSLITVVTQLATTLGTSVAGMISSVMDGVLAGIAADVTVATGGIAAAIGVALVAIPAIMAAPFVLAAGAIAAAIGTIVVVVTPVLVAVGALAAGIGTTLAGAAVTAAVVLGSLTGGILALGAAMTGATVLLSHFGAAGAQSIVDIRKLGLEVGLTAKEISSLADTTGVSGESMVHAVFHLQRSVAEATDGVKDSFRKMGIDLINFQGMSSGDQLKSVYAGFGNLTSQADKASVAMQLFGRAGLHMLESLGRGSAGLEDAQKLAERFGLVFSDAEGKTVKDSVKAWKQWSLAMEGVSRKLAVAFAPVWKDIGEFGGRIGEKLVKFFGDPQVIAAAQGVWSAVKGVLSAAWEGIQSVAASALKAIGLEGALTGENIKNAIVKTLITIEFGLRNLGPLAQFAWSAIKMGAVDAVAFMLPLVNEFIDGFSAMFAQQKEGFANFLRGAASGMQTFTTVTVSLVNVIGGSFWSLLRGTLIVFEAFANTAIDAANKVLPAWKQVENIKIPTLPKWQDIPTIQVEKWVKEAADIIDRFQLPDLKIKFPSLDTLVTQLHQEFRGGLAKLDEDFSAFMKRRLEEINTGPAEKAGESLGQKMAQGLEKEIPKFDAVLVGSAEALQRYEQQIDRIFGVGPKEQGRFGVANVTGSGSAQPNGAAIVPMPVSKIVPIDGSGYGGGGSSGGQAKVEALLERIAKAVEGKDGVWLSPANLA